MKLGVVINETWAFFNEVYEEFAQHHSTHQYQQRQVNLPIFRERVNRYLQARDFQLFLGNNDVVFFEWASEWLANAARLPKRCGIVARLHRYEMYQWADAISWEAVDKLILVSHAKRREFEFRFPQHVDKAVVIPEAISLDKFQYRYKPFGGNIGILCHLTPRKRVYELILAFYELNKVRKDLRLHIGGGQHPLFKDYHDALHAIVKNLNLQDRVIFYDNVAQSYDWYSKIDIFISNSYSEGLQVSPIEAIASGCYCFSHWWDGADELLPVDNLCYTDQEMLEKIGQYCDTTENDKQTRQGQLRELIRTRFDVAKTKVQIRQVVEEVAALPAHGSQRAKQ